MPQTIVDKRLPTKAAHAPVRLNLSQHANGNHDASWRITILSMMPEVASELTKRCYDGSGLCYYRHKTIISKIGKIGCLWGMVSAIGLLKHDGGVRGAWFRHRIHHFQTCEVAFGQELGFPTPRKVVCPRSRYFRHYEFTLHQKPSFPT